MNRFPQPGAEIPPEWEAEFVAERESRTATNSVTVARILLVFECLLLAYDYFRTQQLVAGIDNILAWRLSLIAFLVAYLLVGSSIPVAARLRIFLAACLAFACWITIVIAPLSGDMAVFTMAVLAIAALAPLPGWFNVACYVACTAGLSVGLVLQQDDKSEYWLVNVVMSCVVAIVIDRLRFTAFVNDFLQRKRLERQRERLDELLYNVFPKAVAESLKKGRRSVASHSEVTILFADVVGFTQLATRLLPSQLVEMLETLFGRFDRLAVKHGVEKIKTIGDAYMAITGAPTLVEQPVERMAAFALDIVAEAERFGKESGFDVAIRVGIHTGPVVAGVIGSSRLCYDLWGESVNLAQRIETQAGPHTIYVSEPIYHRLRHAYHLEDLGALDLKGVGPTPAFELRGPIGTS